MVGGMLQGRGYEISPEHKEFMAQFAAARQHAAVDSANTHVDSSSTTDEPSARDGILSERFLCGPPLTADELADPYYSQGLGPVFFPPDAWPAEAAAPGLRAGMRAAHRDLSRVGGAALAAMGAALGLGAGHFAGMARRATSNLQVRVRSPCLVSGWLDPDPHPPTQ